MADRLKSLDISILNDTERSFYSNIKKLFPPGQKKFTMNDIARQDWGSFESVKNKGFIMGCDPSEWFVKPDGKKIPCFEVVEFN